MTALPAWVRALKNDDACSGRQWSGPQTRVDSSNGSTRLLIDGQPITEVSMNSLRQSIGLVSQDVYLFEGSIRDNILVAEPRSRLVIGWLAIGTPNHGD